MTTSIHDTIVRSELLKKAYEFAKAAHAAEHRKNGDPYFNHCLATVETLAAWGMDETTLAAGFLHDVPKMKGADPEASLAGIEREFGADVGRLVRGFVAIGKVPYRGTEHRVESLRRFIIYTSRDARVMIIKFAARLDTMRSLYIYPEATQKMLALKTMDVYAPLANQLGMYRIARDLEDLSFPYLYPKDYQALMEAVRDRFEERETYLEKLKPLIMGELQAYGVPVLSVESRAKHYFSLYRKLVKHNMDLDRIYDLVAVRVIVPTLVDCYSALGVIHKSYPPIPGRIKDYIAAPKPNGYQSIHTTVTTPEGKITEIQIRTETMHQIAEFGIAAHYSYARTRGRTGERNLLGIPNPEELALTRELRTLPGRLDELDLFKNRVLTLTPKGEVIELPRGATPVDFAYRIHSDIGARCAGAKVNGAIVPLHAELNSGDVVEILTQRNKKPSESWLTFVKTSHARDSIRAALRTEETPARERPAATRGIRLTVEDRPGLLREVNRIITAAKIKIQKMELRPAGRNSPTIEITIAAAANRLPKLLEKLKHVHGVRSVRAVTQS